MTSQEIASVPITVLPVTQEQGGRVAIGLSAETLDLLARAKPKSTKRAYRGDLRRFVRWCAGHDLVHLIPDDADDRMIADAFTTVLAVAADMRTVVTEYAGHLVGLDRAPSTIERAVAAISGTFYAATGMKLPLNGPREAIKAHRKDRGLAKRGRRRAAALTVPHLRVLVDATDATTVAGLRDRVVIVLGFALGCRRGELAALDLDDLTEDSDGLNVLIRTSKADKESTGREVFIPYGEHPDTCPVRVVRAWRQMLAEHGRRAGPLLVRVDRHGKLGRAGSGRVTADGRITGQAVGMIVNRTAGRAGLDPTALWSGHSLRRGFATEAYARGADRIYIARHGGWDDNSRALSGYIEDVDRKKRNPLIGIGL